jgi:uncharacterized delta-60 repeat protein
MLSITVNSLLDQLDYPSTVVVGELTGPTTTLRDAITAANNTASASPVTIQFAPSLFASGPGTIPLGTFTNDSTSFGPAALVVTSNVEIEGPASGYGLTIARQSGDAFRLFTVDAGASLELDNVTLSDGLAAGFAGGSPGGGGSAGMGGAIFNEGSLTLAGSTLTGNLAVGGNGAGNSSWGSPYAGGGGGGGVGGAGGNSSFFAAPGGGGYLGGGGGGQRAVYGSNSTAGYAGSFGGGGGGGGGGSRGYAPGPGGTGGFGGGGGAGGSNALGVTAAYGPGGLGGGNGAASGGGGGAGMGGAVFNDAGTVTITNCTFGGNTARGGKDGGGNPSGSGLGGAVFSYNGSTDILSSTISGNTADDGGGVFAAGYGGTANLNVHNTIIANSTLGSPSNLDISTEPTAGGNVAVQASGNLFTKYDPGVFTTGVVSSADPQLAPLGSNGGPTMTFALLPGSPAIDAGDDAAAAGLTTDQRGLPRISGAHVDIGAYEVQPPPVPVMTGLTGAASVDEGSVYSLTLGTVTDPNPEHVISAYVVHWGDGTTSTYPAATLPPDRVVTHTYPDGPATEQISVDVVENPVLDGSFGSGGETTTDFPGRGNGDCVAVAPNGDLVVFMDSGSAVDFMRYLPNGTLDTSFGGGSGRVAIAWPSGFDLGQDNLAVDSAGHILVAGYVYGNGTNADFAVARFNADGSLDTTFGSDGVASLDLGSSQYDNALSIATDASGDILLAGETVDPSTHYYDVGVVRLLPSGAPDPAFGNKGVVIGTDPGGGTISWFNGMAVAVDPASGKVLVFADYGTTSGARAQEFFRWTSSGSPDTMFAYSAPPSGDFVASYRSLAIDRAGNILVAGTNYAGGPSEFAVARYTSAGVLDGTFASNGVASIGFASNYNVAEGLAIDASGRVVLSGQCNIYGANPELGLARLTDSGAPDTSFGSGSVTTTLPSGDEVGYSPAVDPTTGDLVVLASTFNGLDFVRYLPDGSLDTSFGGGSGRVPVQSPNGFYPGAPEQLTIDAAGHILLAGYVYNNGTGEDFAVARYNADGSLDTTFGTNGVASIDLGFSSDDTPNGIATDAAGDILLTGYTYNTTNGHYDVGVVRLLPDGAPDSTFGSGGVVVTDLGTGSGAYWNGYGESVAVDPTDGNVVVYASTSDGTEFIRYTPSGSLDTSFGGGSGAVVFSSSVSPRQLVIDGSGRLLLGGYVYNSATNRAEGFAATRYNPDGSLDTTFGSDGVYVVDVGTAQNAAYGLAVDGQGRILLAGYTFNAANGSDDIGLVRLLADGPYLNVAGTTVTVNNVPPTAKLEVVGVTTDFLGFSEGYSLAVAPNGDIVAMAQTDGGSGVDFVRYLPGGALDTSFGGGKGFVAVDVPQGFSVNSYDLAIDPSGRILVPGVTYGSGADFAVACYNADGSLDTSFGSGGVASVDLGLSEENYAYGIATDTAGHILLTGETYVPSSGNYDIALARLTDTGTLDPTFGTGGSGVVTTDFGGGKSWWGYGTAVAVDPTSGNILVFAYTSDSNPRWLVRYTSTGILDTSFGNGSGEVALSATMYFDEGNLAIDGSGHILMGGSVEGQSGLEFAVARYNADGSLDTTFGNSGVASADLGSWEDFANGVALDAQGNILLAGYTYPPSSNVETFALARLTPNGVLDPSFGTGGSVETFFSGNDYGYSAAVDPTTGNIVVLARTYSGLDFVRYRPDGSLDTSFGNGTGRVPFSYMISPGNNSLAIDGAGHILVAGYVYDNTKSDNDFAVECCNADGSLDTTFGTGGVASFSLGHSQNDVAYGVTTDAGGNILVTGETYDTATGQGELFLARLTPNGALDDTFGTNGVAVSSLSASQAVGYCVAVDPSSGKILVFASITTATGTTQSEFVRYTSAGILDSSFGNGTGLVAFDGAISPTDRGLAVDASGRILVGGDLYSPAGSRDYFAAARYTADGVLDTSFGTNGVATFDFGSTSDYAIGITADPQGRILLAGYTFTAANGSDDIALARLLPDGTPDSSFPGKQVGVPISVLASAIDPSPVDQAAGFTYKWTVTCLPLGATTASPYASGSGSPVNFTPSQPGVYTISLTATDKDGGVSQPAVMVLTVEELRDTTPVQTYTAFAGGSTGTRVLETFTDGNPLAAAGDFTPYVNWGGTVTGTPAVSVQEVSHTATSSTWEVLGSASYAAAGVYPVNVTVQDTAGSAVSTSNTTFNVLAVVPAQLRTDVDSPISAAALTAALVQSVSGLPQGDSVSVVGVDSTATQGGVTFWSGTGQVAYDPTATAAFASLPYGQTTTDTFQYTLQDAQDGNQVTLTATVTLSVSAGDVPASNTVNLGTISEGGTASMGENALVLASQGGSVPGNQTVSFTSVTPINGTTSGSPTTSNGAVVYTPTTATENSESNGAAQDSFQYTVTNGHGLSSTGTVTVTVDYPTPTISTNAGLTVAANGTGTIASSQLQAAVPGLAGPTAAQLGELIYTLTSPPTDGTLTLTVNGVATALALNGTFTQAEINAGDLNYTSKGSAADSFGFSVTNGPSGTATSGKFLIFTVTPAQLATDVNSPLGATSGLLASVTGLPPGDTLSVLSVNTAGTQGSVTLSGGQVTYDPTTTAAFASLAYGSTTTDSFQYTLQDQNGNQFTATATVTLGVSSGDVPAADTVNLGTITEGSTASITDSALVLASQGGSVPANQSVSFAGAAPISGTTTGLLSASGGSVAYTPTLATENSETNGTAHDSFAYTVTNGHGLSSTGTVTVAVNYPAPTISSNAGLTMIAGNSTAITSGELLATVPGVSNAPASELIYTVTTPPANGTLTLTVNGVATTLAGNATFTQAEIDAGDLSYNSNGSQGSTDSFGFSVTNGPSGPATSGTFAITILTVTPAQLSTDVNAPIPAATATAALVNSVSGFPQGDTVSVVSVNTAGTKGAVAFSGGQVSYDPTSNAAFAGVQYGQTATDTFQYTLQDQNGCQVTATATVTLSVSSADGPANAPINLGTISEGSTASITQNALVSASQGGSVPANQTVSFTSVAPIAGATTGSLATSNGSVVYTPSTATENSETNGTAHDSFNYTVTNGHGLSSTGTVTVTVTYPAPTLAVDSPLSVRSSTTATITSSQLQAAVPGLANPSPAQRGELIFTLSTLPAHGTLKLNGNPLAVNGSFTQAQINAGNLSYANAGGTATSDGFAFSVTNGPNGPATSGAFSIKIQAGLTLTTDAGLTVNQGSTATISKSLLLVTDSNANISPSALVYTLTAACSQGTLRLGNATLSTAGGHNTFTQADINNGRLTYAASGSPAKYSDYFTFSVSDGTPAAPLTGQSFAITIADPPTITANKGLTLNEATTATITSSLLAAGGDTGGTLVYQIVAAPNSADGTLQLLNKTTKKYTALGAGSTFTQAQINAGLLAYQACEVYGGAKDSFSFIVSNTTSAGATKPGGVSASFSVTIAEVPVQATANLRLSATAKTSTTFQTATFVDPAGALINPGYTDYSARINWGDGTSSAGVIGVKSSSVFTVTGTHTYKTPGSYMATTSISHGGTVVSVTSYVTVTSGGSRAAVLSTAGTSASSGAGASGGQVANSANGAASPNDSAPTTTSAAVPGQSAYQQGVDFLMGELADGTPGTLGL